jgi:micrococcal nuclease
VLVLAGLAVLVFLQQVERVPFLFSSANPEKQALNLHGPYSLLYVIDGDTLAIDLDGEETRVRLIGVDTPESVHPDPEKNSADGKRASAFLRNLLADTDGQLYLEYDVQRTDAYGRTLAYVYLSDGETMLQEELLRSGMATTLTIQPNCKYAERFYELYRSARESQVGLFSEESR